MFKSTPVLLTASLSPARMGTQWGAGGLLKKICNLRYVLKTGKGSNHNEMIQQAVCSAKLHAVHRKISNTISQYGENIAKCFPQCDDFRK